MSKAVDAQYYTTNLGYVWLIPLKHKQLNYRAMPNAIISWSDHKPAGIGEVFRIFKPVFKEVVPINTGRSFKYHMNNYLFQVLNPNPSPTLNEELVRFKEYITKQYEKQSA